MQRKVQEHKQELERLQQATKLDKQKLIHEAKLKNEAATVSSLACSSNGIELYDIIHLFV